MMRLLSSAALLLTLLAPATAADVKAGRQVALGCQGCHGMDGLSKQPDAPNLAAQPALFLVKAMAEYRAKTRQHEQMNVVAQALSEREIADVAAYYAAIEIEVVKTPQ